MTKKLNPRGNNRPHKHEGRNVLFEISSGGKECGSEGGEVLSNGYF
jgi:hypothetical protein